MGFQLKPFGAGIVQGVLLGCHTMSGDRVSFLLFRRVTYGQLKCFDCDPSDEVQYAT